MVCTFFGHRQVTKEIEPTLRAVLIDLIENHDVKRFYVGNHGGFDAMVQRVLEELSRAYEFRFYVVLAYLPEKKGKNDFSTVFPEGLETVPKHFAISYRNKWMIAQSDYVVTYVNHKIGSGAAQFKALAEKQKKIVIELSSK